MTLAEMVRWHHQLSGHEFEQTQEDSKGQGCLACCINGISKLDMTYQLNNNNNSECKYMKSI